MRLPTVKIATKNGPVIINAKDYDPETMKLATAGDDSKKSTKQKPAQEPQQPAQTPATSQEPATPAQTPAAGDEKPVMLVTKKDKKYIVVDDKGNPVVNDKIEAEGYDSEETAWSAIMAVAG